MSFLKEKLQNINNRLTFLLPQFRYINVKKFNELYNQINNIVIGDNKASSYLNGTIQEITELDLNGVILIENQAFYKYTNLISVTIPDSITSIGDYAFQSCTSLENVTIGNGVTSIGNYAFNNCSSLKNVTIGNGVTSIGSYAFSGCRSLKSITIPDSVTSIGYSAFSGCTSLENVTIGNGVTSIGSYAFDNCTKLTDIYLKSTTPPILRNRYSIPSTTTVHVPVGSGDAYRNATYWSSKTIVEDIPVE